MTIKKIITLRRPSVNNGPNPLYKWDFLLNKKRHQFCAIITNLVLAMSLDDMTRFHCIYRTLTEPPLATKADLLLTDGDCNDAS